MAKTATYWQKGESLDYLNKTGAAIPAGTVLKLGAHIGVAGTDIPPEGLGSIHMVGVFKIEKKSGVALAVGDPVKFDDEEGIDKDTGGTATVGYVVEAAEADELTAFVKLLG